MRLTTDEKQFAAWVRPGDVVAFDSLSSLSGLVQWADKAPVNHVALMLDETNAAMANEPKSDAPSDVAIVRTTLPDLLGLARVRAATILRPSLSPGDLEEIAAQVQRFEDDGARFSVVNLFWLFPAAYQRSYGRRPSAGRPGELLGQFTRIVESAIAGTIDLLPDDARNLTCSEFVYRCFVAAGVPIEILEPFDDDEDDAPAAVTGGASRALPPARVKPETVTPGDLWRSPSLDPVAYFVRRPPRPLALGQVTDL